METHPGGRKAENGTQEKRGRHAEKQQAEQFKMAAKSLNGCQKLTIGQNSPTHTQKLKFEAEVLIDCMFSAYNVEGCIQIRSFNN